MTFGKFLRTMFGILATGFLAIPASCMIVLLAQHRDISFVTLLTFVYIFPALVCIAYFMEKE